MAKNPNIHYLDPQLIQQYTYDFDNDSVRVSMGSADFAIEGDVLAQQADVVSGQTGDAISSCVSTGMKDYQVYITAKTNITGSITIRISVAPTEEATNHFQTDCGIIMNSCSSGSMLMSPMLTCIAKSVKISIVANTLAAGESVTVNLVGHSF